jgi:hypothetical protein
MSQRMADSPEFRDELEKRIGTKEYDRISADGHQDVRKGNKYSAAEVISEFRNRPDGVSVNDGDNSMVSKYQSMVDNGTKFNNKAKSYLEKQGITFAASSDGGAEDPTPTPTPEPSPDKPSNPYQPTPPQIINPGNPGDIDGTNVNINQDNDIITNIDGDNNTVNNNQDNSISVGSARQKSDTDFKNMWMKNFFS